jgi:hypothetical protein
MYDVRDRLLRLHDFDPSVLKTRADGLQNDVHIEGHAAIE